MATTTARDLIRLALAELGTLAISETPSAEDSSIAFDKLNLMIDSWSGQNLMHIAKTQENFSLVVGTGNYSIGPSQTFDTAKPLDVVGAYIRDGQGIDTKIVVVDRKNYNLESDKDLQSKPEKIFYDKGLTQQTSHSGTLYLYPVPDYAYTLYLTIIKPFEEFDDLDSAITFPPGYKKAIVENLAINLAPIFGANITKELAFNAEDSLGAVQNINARNISGSVKLDIPGQCNNDNIYSDGYYG